MNVEQISVKNGKLTLPDNISRILKWKYPCYSTPKLEDYNEKIIELAKANRNLPFYQRFDINDDGIEEIILMQRSLIGGFGRLLIISDNNGTLNVEKIKWDRPMNALFFDYSIDKAKPRSYKRKGLFTKAIKMNPSDNMEIKVGYPHIITRGYETRIVYWDGDKYCQEKISLLNNEGI